MAAVRDRDKYFTLGPGGQLQVALFRRDIYPFKMAFDTVNANSAYPVTINSLATLSTQPSFVFKQPLTLAQNSILRDIGSPFIWQSASFADFTDGTDAANWTILLKNNGRARSYMNYPLHIRTVFGTAQLPAILREPLFFPANDQIAVYLAKISAGASSARLYLNGTQYATWSTGLMGNPQAREMVNKRCAQWKERTNYVSPHWLAPNMLNGSGNVALGANATAQFDAVVPEDSHFEAFHFAIVSTGELQMSISEVKTKQLLMNGVVSKANMMGDANYPTLFPTPYLIPAGYRLRFTFTDLSGSTNQIYPVLHGRRIFAPLKDVNDVLEDTKIVGGAADSETQFVPRPLIQA